MITFKEFLTEAEEAIVSANQQGGFIYVYGVRGLLTTIFTSGKLLGFTQNNVNVSDNGFIYVYDSMGTVLQMLPA